MELTGLLTHCGNEELLEREETRRNRDALFRVEVVGSNPAGPTTRRTGPIQAKIFKTLWALKKEGYSEDTLKAKGHRLRYLAKHVSLDDPEVVKGYMHACTRLLFLRAGVL